MALARPAVPPRKGLGPLCGGSVLRWTGSLGRAPEAERPADMAAEGISVTEGGEDRPSSAARDAWHERSRSRGFL